MVRENPGCDRGCDRKKKKKKTDKSQLDSDVRWRLQLISGRIYESRDRIRVVKQNFHSSNYAIRYVHDGKSPVSVEKNQGKFQFFAHLDFIRRNKPGKDYKRK